MEERESKDIWIIGKYNGETFLGRYLGENNVDKLFGVLSDGKLVTFPKHKASGVRKLKLDGEPLRSKITATFLNNGDKCEVEQSIENLLNHLNTY